MMYMLRTCQRRSTRRAFTILELSATTTAVAALVCASVVSLSSIRNDGRNKKCLKNLARIATASASFSTSDEQQRLTPAHPLIGIISGALGEVEWGGKSGRGDVIGGSSADFESSIWGTRLGRGPASRDLNKYIYGRALPNFTTNPGSNNGNWVADTNLDLDIFRCPADRGYTGLHYESFRNSRLSSYDHYGNSYAANALWILRMVSSCRLLSNSPFLRSADRVPAPSQTILYIENNARFAWRPNFGQIGCEASPGDTPPSAESAIIGWHNRPSLFNAAFADGHVATIEMKGHYQPQPNVGIYPDCTDSPDACYNFYRCATIRGPGWQLDTLPAAPIRSTIECGGGSASVIMLDF